ncbi:uncharacterized protein L203_102351 [Cryptococcus depauperatus CBS 7841]|uniref:Uncharacterized protein n=1 Tax=Cryptococcus depauperatus CBS 7841 TaxID=1295531 RepID=A0AAJ8JRN1_9TREE
MTALTAAGSSTSKRGSVAAGEVEAGARWSLAERVVHVRARHLSDAFLAAPLTSSARRGHSTTMILDKKRKKQDGRSRDGVSLPGMVSVLSKLHRPVSVVIKVVERNQKDDGCPVNRRYIRQCGRDDVERIGRLAFVEVTGGRHEAGIEFVPDCVRAEISTADTSVGGHADIPL